MSFVTAVVPVVPMRSEAAHRSEMVSQFLFGESAKLIERVGDFTRIETLYDAYSGWCQSNQLADITEAQAMLPLTVFNPNILKPILCNGATMQIPYATPLHFSEKKN